MEFWGVEVKAGEPLKVQPEFGKLVHISQASLGEVKDGKGAKYVPLRLKIDDKNFIIASLSAEDRTQVMFDLVFEKEFELSHDWKNGSVYFLGYVADDPASDGEEFSDFDDESEDEPVDIKENGNVKPKSGNVKAAKGILTAASAAKAAGAKKEEESESDDDEDDGESDSDDEMALDGGLPGGDSSEDSEEDEDDSSEEEEPPKAQKSKKRPAESEQKTPIAVKKPKSSATPDKTGKKGHTATPFPSKGAGNKKEQTPKSGGQLSCKSCSKTFPSANALQSHSKAKHGGK